MSEKDKELDAMLAPFKKMNPTSAQLEEWQGSVQNLKRKKRFSFFLNSPFYQLTCALVLGIVVGGVVVGNHVSVQNAFCSSPKVCKCAA